jgi:undecaprenyl pyrophosphate phosphatase UppP
MMTKKEEKFIKYWEKYHSKGKWKYAIQYGMIWAIFVVFFTELWQVYDIGFSTNNFIKAYLSRDFLIKFVVFFFGGVMINGLLMWYANEKLYLKITKK